MTSYHSSHEPWTQLKAQQDFFQIRVPSPMHQIEMQKTNEKNWTAFFPSTLSETSLWSGNGVGRGNILVCSRFIRLTTYFEKSVKTSLCHSNQLPLQSFGPQKILHLQQLKHSDERVWGIFWTETEMLERNIEKILLCGENTLFLPVTQWLQQKRPN